MRQRTYRTSPAPSEVEFLRRYRRTTYAPHRQKSDMATLQELLEQKAALERQISAATKASRGEAIAQIGALMAQHGLTPADLTTPQKHATGGQTGSRSKVAPKYRHPETGATWTGRGLKPKWLSEQLANGKQVGDFAI